MVMSSAMPTVMMLMPAMMRFSSGLRGRLIVGVESGNVDVKSLDGHDLLSSSEQLCPGWCKLHERAALMHP